MAIYKHGSMEWGAELYRRHKEGDPAAQAVRRVQAERRAQVEPIEQSSGGLRPIVFEAGGGELPDNVGALAENSSGGSGGSSLPPAPPATGDPSSRRPTVADGERLYRQRHGRR